MSGGAVNDSRVLSEDVFFPFKLGSAYMVLDVT